MDSHELIERLVGLPEADAQRRLLEEHASLLDDQAAHCLKEQADRLLREDVGHSLEMAGLLVYLGDLVGNPFYRALGLLAEANARCIGGLGEYQRAIELYNEAAEIYRQHGRVLEQARSQIGKLYALAFLGRYDEALEIGEWARGILEAHEEWERLAGMTVNLGLIHGRMGADERALALFDQAYSLYGRLGKAGEPYLPWVDQNRSIVLRNLGHFQASIQASQRVWQALTDQGQKVEATRARQNLAVTYFVLGRHNEALRLLDEVRDVFWEDGRQRDVILVDLFITDCLLQLRRFADVLERCRQISDTFTKLGARFEVGQALLNQAVAYAGLQRYAEARESLAEARSLFEQEGNRVWQACADLETAAVLYQEGHFDEGLQVARSCAGVFQAHSLPVKAAQSNLIAARSAAALQRHDQAQRLVRDALAAAESHDVPSLMYQSHHLLGTLALARGDRPGALARYDQAIQELERLRGQLMVEHRIDFVQDKQLVYEDAVCLCLDLGFPTRAMQFAERAKSRALHDLLAYRLDLRVQAREAADGPLVDELMRLRTERDRLYRRWEGREESREEDWDSADQGRQQTRQEVLALEKRITGLWHRLLIRSADYARDASLWRVRTEPIQPYLGPETVLLKYFAAHGQLFAFVITRESVEARQLAADLGQVQQLVRRVRLNLRTASRSQPDQVLKLIPNVQGLLGRLHQLLMAPLGAVLGRCQYLIIVPHGPLHYLPFHALYDGAAYLLERHQISYLPGASFLHYCHQVQPAASGLLVIGHSHDGLIPHALQEAEAVAALFAEKASLEREATLARLQEAAGDCRVIHLAAHGEFRPDNPLFSGLALDGGWLTTLDIFNLQLKASLVTLSACRTGQSVVGGGDELLGLMRAFAYAGAASLVLSQWTVEDYSTAQLMTTFYQKLVDGWDKVAALRHAQLELIASASSADARARRLAHPYFWAPFFLVGQTGPL
jgi:CHAT domain-containing protein/tetratricopeptide (TPR) repeat protein